MSYQESAERINKDLKDFMNSPLQQLNKNQKEFILNTMIQFGQVAKFRCRSNTAYDNFTKSCLNGIAEAKRVKANINDEWETLRAFIGDEEAITKNLKEATASLKVAQ